MTKKTIETINSTSCTGCGLCAVKCPQKCISMEENEEGFRFPVIDSALCVDCGLCLRACPATDAADALYHKSERSYFCGIISDKDTLLKCSSGGVFGLLAAEILAAGGYVCGCVYSETMEAVHIVSNQREDIERMNGSKYVQSRTEQVYPGILSLLKENKTVLFTGTACQIAALRLYLGKEYENLYCVEILCHGVPSPGFFRIYKDYLQKKLGGTIKDIRFRDKRRDGWGSEHRTCVIYEKNGKIREKRPLLPAYFSAFFYGMNLRESCYQCRYATLERTADLTIGDFWGYWRKYKRRFEEGISVVGINSTKGQSLITKVSSGFDMFDYLMEEEAIASNDNFIRPVKRVNDRNHFYDRMTCSGYSGTWKKVYFSKPYRKKVLASIYGALVPAKFRFFLHKLRK